MNNRRLMIALLCALTWLAPARASGAVARDPFQPAARTGDPSAAGGAGSSRKIKGKVGDGERWQLWTTDERGRWCHLDPAAGGTPNPPMAGATGGGADGEPGAVCQSGAVDKDDAATYKDE